MTESTRSTTADQHDPPALRDAENRRVAPTTFQAPRLHWLVRGWLLGALACGTANAASYFVHSGGWSQLWGSRAAGVGRGETLGFPWVLWESGNSYGGYFVDYSALAANLAVACGFGFVCGIVAWSLCGDLNRLVAQIEAARAPGPDELSADRLQFSLRSMLLGTVAAALVCALLRSLFASGAADSWLRGRREVLAGIYLLGPWLLVTAALLPRRLSWQHRVGLIIPLTFGLIAFAVGVGSLLGRTVEDVLLGVFVCWTPQAMLAAIVLTISLLVFHLCVTRHAGGSGLPKSSRMAGETSQPLPLETSAPEANDS